jgi:hypothetical protein
MIAHVVQRQPCGDPSGLDHRGSDGRQEVHTRDSQQSENGFRCLVDAYSSELLKSDWNLEHVEDGVAASLQAPGGHTVHLNLDARVGLDAMHH